MAECETAVECLKQRQRQEVKELQAQIQRLKHGISKGDKKKKKEVTAQIAVLEADLQEKHDCQNQELQDSQMNSLAEDVMALSCAEGPGAAVTGLEVAGGDASKARKPSKAEKRRAKKAKQEQERDEAVREQEVNNLTGPRHLETQSLKSALGERGLALYEIPSDGNCLYAAVTDQLQQQGVKSSVSELRLQAARLMRDHGDDFLPFLTKQDTGEPFTPADFEDYCDKLESTTEWGGQIEITALSRVLHRPIEVVQAGSPSIITGNQEDDSSPLIISYHHHYYGLGAHYNSVRPATQDSGDERDFS